MSFSLRDALRDKSVVEYPTFVVSSAANLAHAERYIATVGGAPSDPIDTANEGAVYFQSSDKLTPTIVSGVRGLECYGSDDEDDAEELGSPKKKSRHATAPDDDTEEDDEGIREGEREFLRALQELDAADPEALKAIIAASELTSTT